jgi:hypothetical protein
MKTRYPSPTVNASHRHSIVTNSVNYSNADEKRLDDHKFNTPEKCQLSIPSLSNKSTPQKINDETCDFDKRPKKNATPLLMAAMAMTELLGGPSSPLTQSGEEIECKRKKYPQQGGEPNMKKMKAEPDNTDGSFGAEHKAVLSNIFSSSSKILDANKGNDNFSLFKRESAFQMVGSVTSLKPSDRPLVQESRADKVSSIIHYS